jgi:hypothetical protein
MKRSNSALQYFCERCLCFWKLGMRKLQLILIFCEVKRNANTVHALHAGLGWFQPRAVTPTHSHPHTCISSSSGERNGGIQPLTFTRMERCQLQVSLDEGMHDPRKKHYYTL